MKRLLFGGLVALGLAVTATPARADCMFEYHCSRHLSYVHTSKNRCWSFNSYSKPLPCTGSCGYCGPAPWNALAAYGPKPYGHAPRPAPAVAPVAPAPAAAKPAFKAPQPTPASKNANGVQQAGYFYYGPTPNAGYGYNRGYNYGAGYGYGYYGYGSYAQAPNYWY